jgi:hypothetical protein
MTRGRPPGGLLVVTTAVLLQHTDMVSTRLLPDHLNHYHKTTCNDLCTVLCYSLCFTLALSVLCNVCVALNIYAHALYARSISYVLQGSTKYGTCASPAIVAQLYSHNVTSIPK